MVSAAPAVAFGAPLINLMPRTEIDRRARVSLVRRWAWGIVAALAVVALASAGTLTLRIGSEVRLAAQNLRTSSLLGEMAALSDVRAAVNLEKELDRFRAQAMASDLRWAAVVGQVRDAAPEGVTITGFNLTPGPIPVGDDPAAEVGAIGTVTFHSASPVESVPLIRTMRTLPGVVDADGWELTSEGDTAARTYTYVLQITLDQSIYTGTYTEDEK